MKKFNKKFLILCIMALILFTGCSKKIDLGTMKDHVYSNDSLGFKITLPKDYFTQDEETKKQIAEIGRNTLSEEHKDLKKKMSESEDKIYQLIMTFKYPLDQKTIFNPGLICNTEKLSMFSGVKTGKDYLLAGKELLKKGTLPFQFPKDIYTQKMGNKDFSVLETALGDDSFSVHQRLYCIVMDGYALNFIISYSNEDELKELENILSTLTFK